MYKRQDETSLKSIQAQYPDQHLVIVYDDQSFKPEYFVILYAKDNTALKEKLDKSISSMVEDGTYSVSYTHLGAYSFILSHMASYGIF